MGGIENAAVHGILHLAGLDHRVHRQKVDLEILAGHGSHAVDVGFGIFKEDATAPGGLHFQDSGFGAGDCRRGDGACCRGRSER